MSPWIQYTAARLGIFIGALTVCLLLGTGWIFGAIYATLIALALSVLFLGGLRRRIAADLQRRVEKPEKDKDSDVEDNQIDAASN